MQGGCGAAFLDSYQGGPPPVGVISQACVGSSSGTYALGHELGHIFGVRHNREVDPSDHPEDKGAHGFLIRGTHARTIMALVDK